MQFDPNVTASSDFGIFGIPSELATSQVVLFPVPWEVTTSYGVGASLGPKIIRKASEQIDLYDIETGKPYEKGIFMKEISEQWLEKNCKLKALAQELISLKTIMDPNMALQEDLLKEVNKGCAEMTEWVYQETKSLLAQGKKVGLIGGDHSTPLGYIKALSEANKGALGILHIDAHADLRNAYQGFHQSHASIMYNVMNLPVPPKKLVQVGIRDFCEEEANYIESQKGRIKTFFDLQTKRRLLEGESWKSVCESIISELPEKVYISFDIDGLDPALCPNTGTPVAGGLSLDQAFYLFYALNKSGRKVVGFDLNEVSPGSSEDSEWDGNVGARILYKLCGWLVK